MDKRVRKPLVSVVLCSVGIVYDVVASMLLVFRIVRHSVGFEVLGSSAHTVEGAHQQIVRLVAGAAGKANEIKVTLRVHKALESRLGISVNGSAKAQQRHIATCSLTKNTSVWNDDPEHPVAAQWKPEHHGIRACERCPISLTTDMI
eukprot:6170171-Amphidinium_carterae.2